MRVTVNGEPTEVAETTRLADLLPPDRRGSAAALNGSVVPHAELAATTLRAGDAVEIVTAVQGG